MMMKWVQQNFKVRLQEGIAHKGKELDIIYKTKWRV